MVHHITFSLGHSHLSLNPSTPTRPMGVVEKLKPQTPLRNPSLLTLQLRSHVTPRVHSGAQGVLQGRKALHLTAKKKLTRGTGLLGRSRWTTACQTLRIPLQEKMWMKPIPHATNPRCNDSNYSISQIVNCHQMAIVLDFEHISPFPPY